jgi:hypothetical protein
VILVNTPADAVAKFIERGLLDVVNDVVIPIHVGFRPETLNQIACTDYSERKDGVLQATGEELVAPRVQVRVRHNDYPTAYLLVRNIGKALTALNQQDLLVLDFPDGAYLFASFHVTSGPIYMGRDPRPGELENFSLNGEMTLIPFTSP